ncbi:MAG TPA: hypothetical protein VJQ06_02050 [Rhizomicrobium sp.]|nr:hypothetical protein [Rhizomicrobium sp.]
MTDEKKRPGPDPEHVMWMVQNRKRTQETAVNLYRLLTQHQDKLVFPHDDSAQLLTGVALSLWRGVFLVGGDLGNRSHNAINVLGEMLQSNAITFPFEHQNKAWTYRYYWNNARSRLLTFADMCGNKELHELLKKQVKLQQEEWLLLQEAFEMALGIFQKSLTGET